MADPITAAPAAPAPAPAAPTSTDAPKLEVVGGDNPPKEGEVKKEVNPQNPDKPFVIKVDGKEHHLTQDEAVRWAQKGMGADRKFNEAHKIKTQAEQFIHLLKTDPMAILNNQNLGLDFKKLAQDFLAKEIETEMMTPEQKELHETREKLKAAEQEKKQREEEQHQQRTEQLVKHFSSEYEKDITTTLETAGLPKTRGTVKRMAYYMQQGLARGVPLKAADVIDIVRKDYIQEHNELYGAADGDTLLKMFGDPIIKKLMEANLKKMRGGEPPQNPPTPSGEPQILTVPTQKLDKEEWRKSLDKHVASL